MRCVLRASRHAWLIAPACGAEGMKCVWVVWVRKYGSEVGKEYGSEVGRNVASKWEYDIEIFAAQFLFEGECPCDFWANTPDPTSKGCGGVST